MNKYAMTIFELLIAMLLMAIITILCIKVFSPFAAKNSDVIKFRHTYATISQVINELKNDVIMYPDATLGFADGSAQTYLGEEKTYSGATKFQKLFKSKFNIYKSMKIKLSYSVPRYYMKYDFYVMKNGDYVIDANGANKEIISPSSNIDCFMDNKGISYCPPQTSIYTDITRIKEMNIYIPIFLNKIDESDPKTTDESKIIFVRVSKDGRVDMPTKVEANSKTIIDCKNQSYNSYYHCLATEKLGDMEF